MGRGGLTEFQTTFFVLRIFQGITEIYFILLLLKSQYWKNRMIINEEKFHL